MLVEPHLDYCSAYWAVGDAHQEHAYNEHLVQDCWTRGNIACKKCLKIPKWWKIFSSDFAFGFGGLGIDFVPLNVKYPFVFSSPFEERTRESMFFVIAWSVVVKRACLYLVLPILCLSLSLALATFLGTNIYKFFVSNKSKIKMKNSSILLCVYCHAIGPLHFLHFNF